MLRVQDFHAYWRIHSVDSENEDILPANATISELRRIQGRGRPQGALGRAIPASSTQRIPSAFEIPPSTAPAALQTSRMASVYVVSSEPKPYIPPAVTNTR